MDSRWHNSFGQEQRALTLYCPQSKLLCNVTCFLFLLWLQVTIILLLIIATYIVLYVIDDDNSVTLAMGRSNKMAYFPGQEEFNKDRSSRVFWILFYGKVQEQPIEWSVNENLPQTQEWAFPAPNNWTVMKSLQIVVKHMPQKGLWWLKIGTCHVPLQRLNSGRCNYSPSTPPERSSDWASDWGTLIWNPDRAGQDIDNS